jgi:Glutamine cyclotransferase
VPTIQQSALTAAATYFVRLPWYVQPIWWQFRLSVTREKIMAIVYIEARPKGRGEHAPSPDTKGSSYKKESVKTRSAAYHAARSKTPGTEKFIPQKRTHDILKSLPCALLGQNRKSHGLGRSQGPEPRSQKARQIPRADGIAHNREKGTLLVTGKNWPSLWHIKLVPTT